MQSCSATVLWQCLTSEQLAAKTATMSVFATQPPARVELYRDPKFAYKVSLPLRGKFQHNTEKKLTNVWFKCNIDRESNRHGSRCPVRIEPHTRPTAA